MPQFARPDADLSIGESAWEDEGGATTSLWESIDEVAAADGDFVRSELSPSTSQYVARLSDVEDPLVSTGHTLRARFAKDAAGGSQIDMVAQLRQGYVNEGTPGTLIATLTQTDVDENFTTFSTTLSGGEADSITDYTDLAIRFTANQV